MEKTLTDDVLWGTNKFVPFERVQLFILGLYLKEKTTSINSWWLMFFCFLFD